MNKPWYKFYAEDIPKEINTPITDVYQLLERAERKFPDYVAIIDEPRQFTYRELKSSVDCFAASLYNRGIKKGDRIAVMLPNSFEYIVSYFAILKLGGIIVQINPMYQPHELKYILGHSTPVCFISRKIQHEKLIQLENIPDKLLLITADENVNEANNLYAMIAENHPLQDKSSIDVENDIAILQFTGGTTGPSKGVMLTHYNLMMNVHQTYTFFKKYTDQPGEKMFGSSPLFHIAGIVTLNLAFYTGTSFICVERFTVPLALQYLRKYRPTIFQGVPTIYIGMLNDPNLKEDDLSSVKVFGSGTAPLKGETLRRLQAITNAHIYESFGMSEALVACRTPYNHMREGSVGVPLPSIDVKISDLDTGEKTLPPGEIGELTIKGPQIMKGYWKNEIGTKETLRNGWLHTGDLAKMDEDGYVYIVGRKKDMILASGYNIYPDEIEEVILQHPAVLDVGAFGVPDAYRGETVKVAIVLKDGKSVTEQEMIAWCQNHLARYKVPKIIEFTDKLPKSAVGKLLRRKLREKFS